MNQYADIRNEAVNNIIAQLWELPDDQARFAVFAFVFSVLVKEFEEVKQDPVEMAGRMVAVYRMLQDRGDLDEGHA
jgi:hypothetical protein